MATPLPRHTGAVLVDHQLKSYIDKGRLRLNPEYVQPASFDLPVGKSVHYATCIPSLADGFQDKAFIGAYCHTGKPLGGKATVVIMPGITYLIELNVELDLPKDVYGYANPKSSAGRCDLDCTVLAVGGTEYNVVPAGYKGKLYLLVTAQSFPVVVRENDTLVQLRLHKGERRILSGKQVRRLHGEYALVGAGGEAVFTDEGILLHLHLHGTPSNLVSIPNGDLVDLSLRKQINPTEYFREKKLEKGGSLMLEPHEFVLATTKERLRIPPYLCTEMVAYTEKQGPFRSHFAGYFDPGFGHDEEDVRGAGVVLEIRNLTNRRLQLADGQGVCVMRYELLQAPPERLYGRSVDGIAEQSHYHFQTGIRLAKYFQDWPS